MLCHLPCVRSGWGVSAPHVTFITYSHLALLLSSRTHECFSAAQTLTLCNLVCQRLTSSCNLVLQLKWTVSNCLNCKRRLQTIRLNEREIGWVYSQASRPPPWKEKCQQGNTQTGQLCDYKNYSWRLLQDLLKEPKANQPVWDNSSPRNTRPWFQFNVLEYFVADHMAAHLGFLQLNEDKI